MQSGASALSVLTDERFFGGSNQDLTTARRFNWCPILRKDFIIDEYQLVEARSLGADAILLIAAALEPSALKTLAGAAKRLGLEVLLEVHTERELERALCDEIDVVGVNSRDLKDFSVDLARAERVRRAIPAGLVTVAESGIHSAADAKRMRECGYDGLLIGELFMRTGHPERALQSFLKELRALS
jgi:indole-3-glycerol phosphate synthase